MNFARINKRVPRFSEMPAQLNNFVVFSRLSCRNATNKQSPSQFLLKVQCFCSSRYSSRKATLSNSNGSILATRVSRVARTEAQEVLFDYLHSTRSLSFTDAEYISKNSPGFVDKLLSKVSSDKDVKRSLSRFLRYNPINEFEPFLESLGLSPTELSSILPQRLMFLKDDDTLLDNFHVLCSYGIPRSNMGRMFREAREIFGYRHGLLDSKLQGYENMGVSKSTVIKLVSSTPSLLVSGVDNDYVQVHKKLDKIGLKSDWIGQYLSVEESCNWKRMADTMYFLDKVGYNEEQLHDLLRTTPALLFDGSGKKVYVLFGRLLKVGLQMSEVHSLFVQNSELLSVKSAKNLLRALDIMLDIGLRFEVIANIVSTHVEQLCLCPLKGPKTISKELKINKEALREIIEEVPTKLFAMASKSKIKVEKPANAHDPIKVVEKTAFLLRLGYIENTEEMMTALKKFRGRGDQLQERFDCLVEAGLDYNVVCSLIKQAPMVLNLSRDIIEKKIDCLTNCLGYPIESVVAFPAFLCYDLEKIRRRFRMYAWLRDRGAVKPTLSLSSILACSDARFSKYIDKHPDAPAVWESLAKSGGSAVES